MTLVTGKNLANSDKIYQQLLELHNGLSESESAKLNARLILILLNHIGDEQVIEQAFNTASSFQE